MTKQANSVSCIHSKEIAHHLPLTAWVWFAVEPPRQRCLNLPLPSRENNLRSRLTLLISWKWNKADSVSNNHSIILTQHLQLTVWAWYVVQPPPRRSFNLPIPSRDEQRRFMQWYDYSNVMHLKTNKFCQLISFLNTSILFPTYCWKPFVVQRRHNVDWTCKFRRTTTI